MAHHAIPSGVHVLLERAGRVLLIRRANTGFFDGLYSLPGGHIEAGESILMTAVREAREELDIVLATGELELLGALHRMSDTNRIDFFVRAGAWTGEPRRAEPDKCDALGWFGRDALPDAVVPYVREVLRIKDAGPWIRELGWPAPAACTGR